VTPELMLVSGSWGGATLSVRTIDPRTEVITTPTPPIVFGDDLAMCDFDVDMVHGRITFGRVTRKGNIWKLVWKF
jgi:hypothetical protein